MIVFAVLLGLTFISAMLVKELAHKHKVVLGHVEEGKVKEVMKLDERFNLIHLVASSDPEEYVKGLVAYKKGLRVYVSEDMLGSNPCQRRSNLRVRTGDRLVHTNVAYVIVYDDSASARVLTSVRDFLDLSNVKGAVKVVKDVEFFERRCSTYSYNQKFNKEVSS